MYKHIGRKVRGLAVALCLIGVVGSIGTGVYMFVEKILDWPLCIAAGVGGIIASVLSSWILFCIGDTHVKVEKLEDKLIPKPNYTQYLASNVSLRGACEICGRTTDLINAKIEDKLGIRYRKVCMDCFATNNCSQAD